MVFAFTFILVAVLENATIHNDNEEKVEQPETVEKDTGRVSDES